MPHNGSTLFTKSKMIFYVGKKAFAAPMFEKYQNHVTWIIFINLPAADICLISTKISCRCEGKSFPKFIVSLLECVTIDGDHNLARLWSAMICLPHVRPLQEEKTVHKKLSSLIQKLTTLAEKQDKHTRGSIYFLLGPSPETINILSILMFAWLSVKVHSWYEF